LKSPNGARFSEGLIEQLGVLMGIHFRC
jgi:hypothetical protein